jgi:hypothetical protein
MSGYVSANAETLVGIFDAVREEHLIDVMQAGLLACTCGERLPIFYGDDGQPLYNPAIRHHHEQQAAALFDSDWMRQHDAAVRAEAERERDEARGDSPSGFWSQREWEDWSNDLALMIPEDLACGNPEGAQESIIEATLAHLIRCVSVAGEHDDAVRAEALEQAADEWGGKDRVRLETVAKWLRDRAARLRAGGGEG